MLKVQEMEKLRIICSKNKLKSVIDELYLAKALDIIEHKKTDEIDVGSPLAGTDELSQIIVKIRSILFQLKIESERKGKLEPIKYYKTKVREINNLHILVSELTGRLIKIEARQKILTENKNILSAIKKLGVSVDYLKDSNLLKHFIGYIDNLEGFRKDIRLSIHENYDLISARHDNKNIITVFIDKEKEADLLGLFRKYNFTEIKIPENTEKNKETLTVITKELIDLKKEQAQIQKKLSKIKRENSKELVKTESALTVMGKKYEAPLNFAETENLSIITGWVPVKNKNRLIKKLEQVTSNNIIIEDLKISKEDDIPIKLNNPKATNSYEYLLRLFSMPSYKELDPTILIFITFPLFFGFMLGDIGYGLVTLFLFLFLRKKLPSAKALINIMIFCSITSIFFGCVFGEAFGFEIKELLGESHLETIGATSMGAIHSESQADGIVELDHSQINMDAGKVDLNNLEDPNKIDNQDVHASDTHVLLFSEWIKTWPLHRNSDNAINLIILTLLIGAFHVNLGLLLGFINVFRNHGLVHAFLEKAGWFILEIGVTLIGLSMFKILISTMLYIGLLVCIIAAVILYLGEGIQGLVELPAIFVHIGSYMRLMAIGLASVGLAIVINEQTMPLFSKGVFGIISGVLIFTAGHVVNILLGVIGPFLHSLRLHYVEHFTKFYKGGGREFNPFGSLEEI